MEASQLTPLDPSVVAKTLSSPPFVSIDGVINVRDLGAMPSSSRPGHMTRPGYMFRSAEVSSITPEGKRQLASLGIKTIFDLRSDTEMEKYDAPLPEIKSIEVIRVPVFQKEDYSPEMMAQRFQLYASGKTEAFMTLYSQILDNAVSAFGSILKHVRDEPEKPFLFHCTAGKDRTGVLAAILLKLCGVDDEAISSDYALTRIGREPARAMILARLSLEPLFASNNQAALNMFSCRAETMSAFLKHIESRYGGAVDYCRDKLLFSTEDIERIQSNMLVHAFS